MKRQSIAETTLKKQIKNIEAQIDALNIQTERLGTRIRTLRDIHDDLEAEVEALYSARTKSTGFLP